MGVVGAIEAGIVRGHSYNFVLQPPLVDLEGIVRVVNGIVTRFNSRGCPNLLLLSTLIV